MGRIVAVANQKGGVGKTTTVVNLAASFAELGRKVLLVDLDPQGNATMGSGIDKAKIESSVTDILLEDINPHPVIQTCKAGFDLLPANRELTAAEIGLLKMNLREFRLLQALAKVRDEYECVFIDCPPSLNMLTINALVAAHSVLIPMQCEYYALEGLSGLLETIEHLKQKANPKLFLEGIVRTMVDGRNRLCNEVTQELQRHFPGKVYQNAIPRNVRLAEAPSFGMPALLYDRSSAGAKAYLGLAQEMIEGIDASKLMEPIPILEEEEAEV